MRSTRGLTLSGVVVTLCTVWLMLHLGVDFLLVSGGISSMRDDGMSVRWLRFVGSVDEDTVHYRNTLATLLEFEF